MASRGSCLAVQGSEVITDAPEEIMSDTEIDEFDIMLDAMLAPEHRVETRALSFHHDAQVHMYDEPDTLMDDERDDVLNELRSIAARAEIIDSIAIFDTIIAREADSAD
jgi:hypothetical protein